MLRHGLSMFLVVVFLQEQVGTGVEECVRQLLRGDHRDGVAILRAETAEKIEHLALLENRLANIAKCVNELLEAAGVLGYVHVTLHEIAEFGL